MDHHLQPKAAPIQEAERFSGLSKSTLRRLNIQGDLKFIKIGRRRLVDLDSLRALLERGVADIKAA